MSSAPASPAAAPAAADAAADVSGPASPAVGAGGEDEDEFDDAISKSILPGRF